MNKERILAYISRYPDTTEGYIRKALDVMTLSSDEESVAKAYTKRLITFSNMAEGSKKERYKSEKIEPFYEKAREDKELGDAIAIITQIVFPEVGLG